MADAAVHVYGEEQVELAWEGDQVQSRVELRALDAVDFVVRFDRTTRTMHAVSISPTVAGHAPPGAVLVLPRAAEPASELHAVDRRKHAAEEQLAALAGKAAERELGGGEEEERCRLVQLLGRLKEEHVMRKAQVYNHKPEWWAQTWSESRARSRLSPPLNPSTLTPKP